MKPVNINIIQINNDFGIFLYTSGHLFPNFKLKKYKERYFKVKRKPIQWCSRTYLPSNYFQPDICEFLSKKISDKYNCYTRFSIDHIPKDKIDECLIEMYYDELEKKNLKSHINLQLPQPLPPSKPPRPQYLPPLPQEIIENKPKTTILESMVESLQEPIEIIDQEHFKKQPKIIISHLMKRKVWDKWIGEEIGKTKCPCCKMTDITQLTFVAGHIQAESRGGEYSDENLIPICQSCNLSMGTKNMHEFMKTHGLELCKKQQDKNFSFEELNKKIKYEDIKGSKIEIEGKKMSYVGLLRETIENIPIDIVVELTNGLGLDMISIKSFNDKLNEAGLYLNGPLQLPLYDYRIEISLKNIIILLQYKGEKEKLNCIKLIAGSDVLFTPIFLTELLKDESIII